MLIKSADDKTPLFNELEALIARTDLTPTQRKNVEAELRRMRAGEKGEREVAYEINFHLGKGQNWMVLHDLRFEYHGRVAQIDHLLINRFLEVYVVETKHYNAGLQINEQGEFTAWYGSKSFGIPSPLAQNEKHIAVLQEVFSCLELPTRLGFTLRPTFHSVIMVSTNARITRPGAFDTRNVIKADAIAKWLQRDDESGLNIVGALAKVVSTETLRSIAEQLAEWHYPASFDFKARFGIAPPALTELPPTPVAPPASVVEVPAEERAATETPTQAESPTEAPKSKLICAGCATKVNYNVAKFCWTQKAKFGGKVYCYDCQRTLAAAS